MVLLHMFELFSCKEMKNQRGSNSSNATYNQLG